MEPNKLDTDRQIPLEQHARPMLVGRGLLRSSLKSSKKDGQFLIAMEKINSRGSRVSSDLQADICKQKVKISINPSAAVPRIYTKLGAEKGKNVGVGIFKDAGETDPKTVPTITRTKRALELTFKKALGMTRPTDFLAGKSPYSKAFSEVMAFEFAEYFGFNADPQNPLVPLTILSKEPGKETGAVGTFQQFVQEHTLAKEGTALLTKNDLATFNPDNLSKEEKLVFLRFIIFDYLIGNLDRHDKNWMMKIVMNEGKPTLVAIAAIDNGNSFPVRHPTDSATLKENNSRVRMRQYEWRDHILAKITIDDELRDAIKLIAKDISEDKLQTFLKAEKDKFSSCDDQQIKNHVEVFFGGQMQDHLTLRLKALHAWADSPHPTIGSLAKLQSSEEINDFLKSYAPKVSLAA